VENLPAALVEKGDIKIKVIRKIGGDDHTAQFLAGAKKEGESLVFQVDTFSANGDTLKFHQALEQAATSDAHAVIVSHGDDQTAQFLAGAKKEGESLGFQVDTFSANGDTLKFHEALEQAANSDADAVIVSHGDDQTAVELVQNIRDKGIEVVTFDSLDEMQS